MTDICASTYVVYFADKDHLPESEWYAWSACSGAETSDGRLILTFEHNDRFEDLTDTAGAIGEVFASAIGNSVDEVVFVEMQVTGQIAERWAGGPRRRKTSTAGMKR